MVGIMQVSDRIGRRIKLQDLHVLLTVAQEGSMGKAAQRLNSTQPAVSRSIAELEHTLGVRLLDRHHQGVAPTAYGQALLSSGANVFDELRQAVNNIEHLADPTNGEVRIGSSPALASTFVSAVVARLSDRHPRVIFHVMATQWEGLHRALTERHADFLIAPRFGPFADDQLNFEAIYKDRYVVVAGEKHPLVGRRKVSITDLLNESWTLPPPETVLGAIAMDAFRKSGLRHPRAMVFSAPGEVRLSLLTTGRFLTVCPTSVLMFPKRRSEFKVLPVDLPIANVPTGVVTLKGRTLNPAARIFIECARDLAKAPAKGK
jgi:DNA-binding transcriptional LysR family regulator